MSGRTLLALFLATLVGAACNPVDPQVDKVDGAMYTRPGGGSLDAGLDGGPRDGGDGGPRDAGPKDAGKG